MLYKIIVKHTSIWVYGYKRGDCPQLENNFKMFDKVNFIEYYKGIEFIPDKEILILPRGMDIYYLESLLGVQATIDTKHNSYEPLSNNIKMKVLPRSERQKETLKFMIGADKYRSNLYKSQFSINLNTGVGKTYCAVGTACYLNIRSIVITSSIGWLKQWKEKILEYTNLKKENIYIISGANSIYHLLNDSKKANKYRILLASDSTLRSWASNHGWESIGELFEKLKIGLKFYDEAHLHFDNMCLIDFYTNIYKTFYLTATPARSDDKEDRIYQIYFKNIVSINLFDKNVDPHTTYIALKFNSHPSIRETNECKTMYGLSITKYANYIVKKPIFYDMITILMDIILRHKGKSLVYIATNSSIEIVKEWIETVYPELIGHVGIYTSIIKEKKQEQLDKKIILSTTKSCGAAMDIQGLKFTNVLAEPFKSKVIAKQSLGRTRDRDTYYIDLVDVGFYSINNWHHSKKALFLKYALACKEINFTDKIIVQRVAEINAKLDEYRKRTRLFITPSQKLTPLLYKGNHDLLYKNDVNIKLYNYIL